MESAAENTNRFPGAGALSCTINYAFHASACPKVIINYASDRLKRSKVIINYDFWAVIWPPCTIDHRRRADPRPANGENLSCSEPRSKQTGVRVHTTTAGDFTRCNIRHPYLPGASVCKYSRLTKVTESERTGEAIREAWRIERARRSEERAEGWLVESHTQATAGISRLQQAYQRRLAKMMALSDEDLESINLDISAVYALASGAMINVRAFREQVLSIPFLDKEAIMNLEDDLLAMGHAQALHLAATTPAASIPAVYAKLIELRARMFADCSALAARGFLPGDKLRELKGPTSHTTTAFDVLAMATMCRAVWEEIQGKTAMQVSDIEEAETLADRLLTAVGERAVSDKEVAAATQNRKRAYTLFTRAYDEMRRGVACLRWHERDVDELFPTLETTRGAGRPKKAAGDTPVTDAPPAQAPAPPSFRTDVPVGHPDSSPFSS